MKRSVLFFSAAVVFSMAFAPAAVNSIFSKGQKKIVKNAQVITENSQNQENTAENSQVLQNSGQSAEIENKEEF